MNLAKKGGYLIAIACIVVLLILQWNVSLILPWNVSSSTSKISKNFHGHQPLCVVARIYPAQYSYISTFLLSILANSIPPQVFFVVTDNDRNWTVPQRHIDFVNELVGFKASEILPIYSSDAEYISSDYSTTYGYAYTDAAINYLVERNSNNYQCEYILFTNGDNLYRKEFIDDYLDEEMKKRTDLIGFNFISHHRRFPVNVAENVKDDGMNHEFSVSFQATFMDLGACFFKFDLFQRNDELRFVKMANGEYFSCDGILIEQTAKRSNSTMIFRDVLFFHQ